MPDKLESFAGKPIVLEIEVSRPNSEVKWWLNGREIEESSNITITEDGLIHRLTIHSPTPEDTGKYTCDAVDDKVDFQVKVSGKRQCKNRIQDDFYHITTFSKPLKCDIEWKYVIPCHQSLQ